MPTLCRAKDQSNCRYHGRFTREYEKYVEKLKKTNSVPKSVFEATTVEKLHQDEKKLIAVRHEKGEKLYRLLFVRNAIIRGEETPAEDDSMYVSAKNAALLEPSLADKVDKLYRGNTHSRVNEQALNAFHAISDGKLQPYLNKGAALEKATRTPHINDDWDISPATVHIIYQYGQEAEKLGLREEETAIVMHQSLVKHERFNEYEYGEEGYDEQLIGLWSVYTTYKKEIQKDQ